MRVIVATIRAEKLMAVQRALDGQDVRLMYAAQVADVWHEQTCTYRGLKYQMPQPRLRLEILVVDEKTVSEILEAINAAAFASNSRLYGSGDLFTAQIDDWVSIRSKLAAFQPAQSGAPEPAQESHRDVGQVANAKV